MEKKNLITALVKAQSQMKAPAKEGFNPMYKSKYVTLDSIYAAIRKPLSDNGLSLSHSVEVDEANRYFLITTLMHVSGEFMQNKFPMVIEKLSNQGIASARTYACRYAVCNMMALPSDEDDDGNAAEIKLKTLSEDQCKEIEAYTTNDEDLKKKILTGYNVKTFSEIRASNFGPIMKNLQKRTQLSA
jgi:hypothetical protein